MPGYLGESHSFLSGLVRIGDALTFPVVHKGLGGKAPERASAGEK